MASLVKLIGVFLLALTGAGCESNKKPITLSCETMGYFAVPKPGEKLRFENFSTTAPAGGDWCLQDRSTKGVQFVSSPWIGKKVDPDIDPDLLLNTFALAAAQVSVTQKDVDQASSLRGLVEIWIANGFGVRVVDSRKFLDLTPQIRFATVSASVDVDADLPPECVRYAYQMAERNNPGAPDKILRLEDSGVICQLPLRPDLLIIARLLERHVLGKHSDPSLYLSLKTEVAEPVFRNLDYAR